MGGAKWTSTALGDREWLDTKLLQFAAIRGDGKARKKNPAKDAYLLKVYDEYDKLYPGRIASFNFNGIGTGGTDAERKDTMIKVSATPC
jgi:hypothetical protein